MNLKHKKRLAKAWIKFVDVIMVSVLAGLVGLLIWGVVWGFTQAIAYSEFRAFLVVFLVFIGFWLLVVAVSKINDWAEKTLKE